jgi:hypothetical protein
MVMMEIGVKILSSLKGKGKKTALNKEIVMLSVEY